MSTHALTCVVTGTHDITNHKHVNIYMLKDMHAGYNYLHMHTLICTDTFAHSKTNQTHAHTEINIQPTNQYTPKHIHLKAHAHHTDHITSRTH